MSLEGKTEEEIKSLEGALLAEVENQGGAAGNVSLLRSLKWDDDLYWSVRDRLVDAGQLELGRGRGGSVRRVFTDDTQITTPPSPEIQSIQIAEAQLYEPVAKVLKERRQ